MGKSWLITIFMGKLTISMATSNAMLVYQRVDVTARLKRWRPGHHPCVFQPSLVMLELYHEIPTISNHIPNISQPYSHLIFLPTWYFLVFLPTCTSFHHSLSGWWLDKPLWKIWVNWDDEIPKSYGNIKVMFQSPPTSYWFLTLPTLTRWPLGAL